MINMKYAKLLSKYLLLKSKYDYLLTLVDQSFWEDAL